ncbi:F-box-like protein [Rhynchospora pubera]|uniref:F-box-like protein n=1 Tax=Rhynchospora pubera TaxID=906938 RepID=A0AAV8FPU7_9POAL|nr:F-box-like protein [Rhynchospora pubera]
MSPTTNESLEPLMDARELSFVAPKVKNETNISEGKTYGFIPLPEIVGFILLLLEARDVCSLSSCSKVLHSICNSDYVWKELYRRRWPQQFINTRNLLESCTDDGVIYGTQSSGHARFLSVHSQGWKALYIKRHREMASIISSYLAFVDTWIIRKYLDVVQFLNAVKYLNSMELSFEDVCYVIFSTKLSVHANLIGLQYSITFLGVENKDVKEAIVSRGVAEREVRLKWFKRVKYFDQLRVPAHRCYLTCSIGKIAMDKEVVAFLSRGRTTNVRVLRIGTLPDQGIKQAT